MESEYAKINPKDIHNLALVMGGKGDLSIRITTKNGGAIEQPLTDSKTVFACNAFLESLGLDEINITFKDYAHYARLIHGCAELLAIRNILSKSNTAKRYSLTDLHSTILDLVADRYEHTDDYDYIEMVQIKDLPDLVQKAISIISKRTS